MRMNNETKITFALEHIAHLEDLIKDNIDEAILQAYLNDIKGMFERQLTKEQLKGEQNDNQNTHSREEESKEQSRVELGRNSRSISSNRTIKEIK